MKITNSTVALVTGASSGLGAALAVELARSGAKVAITARRQDRLEAVAQQIIEAGGSSLVIPADITNKAEAEKTVRATIETFGTIDLLINNAGRELRASLEATTLAQLESLFALNVFPLWYTTAVALPVMKAQKRGHIVNISSISGRLGSPYHSAYIASKHAVIGFTAALRTELADSGVEASVVSPIGISTEIDHVTEGGGMGSLYEKGLAQAAVASELASYPWTALTLLLKPEEAAVAIIEGIESNKSDIYTHPGSEEIALSVMKDRASAEKVLKPFLLGMKEAYEAEAYSLTNQNLLSS
jgi:short-subunit dehydrogenase